VKLKLLTESTYLIKISPPTADNKGYLSGKTIETTANSDKEAINNAVHRFAKSFGIFPYDKRGEPDPRDEQRVRETHKIEILSKGSHKAGSNYIHCRACGQYRPASPLGDICVDCNKDL